MTVRATIFTPEVLLSAPRRTNGVPNYGGTQVLYTVSTYSFEEHKKTSEVRVLDVQWHESTVVTDLEGASEPNWLDDDKVLLLAPGEKGATKVLVGPVHGFKDNNYVAGTIDASANNVKIRRLDDGKYAFAITAPAKPDGTLYNPETAPKPHSTGRLYKSMFVRHWDTYVTPNRNAIWYGTLSISSSSLVQGSQYKLSTLHNTLKGTGLESPVPPFGGSDNYDLSSSGLIFVAKDPDLNPATNTKCNVYLIALSDFTESTTPKPQQIVVDGFDGAKSSPVFSTDGEKAAFLAMRQNGYETDKNQVFVVRDLHEPDKVSNLLPSPDGHGKWDRSPSSITWSHNDQTIYLLAEDTGRNCVWSLASDMTKSIDLPQKLFCYGTVTGMFSQTLDQLECSPMKERNTFGPICGMQLGPGADRSPDVRPLSSGVIFVSSTNLVDSSAYYKFDPTTSLPPMLISSVSRNGTAFGLSPAQKDEVWWPGARTQVHALVMKPSTFNPDSKYPLAYIVHGGPQGAWTDGWSTRWNPAVFAEQGYVVVCPNPTGSTGYGQAFTDAIEKQWGGLPYQDLVKGFDWIEQNMRYVDTSRAVALGASYGGFMMNWIQGQPLGRKFRALVTHDGVYSMAGQMASEELYFPEHEFGGKFWEKREEWLRWDPAKHTDGWATPHLIVHSELDYRLTMSEGLAAFHTLQDKGVESQFLTFPDENHWVLKPENSLLWHTVVLDWINEHVGLPKYSESHEGSSELKKAALADEFARMQLGSSPDL